MFEIKNKTDIYLTRGDTAYFALTVRNKTTGEPYDFTNDTVVFTVRKNATSKTDIIKKTFEGGEIKLESEDTIGLDYQTLKYDVELVKPNGDNFTIITNKSFTITEEEHTP